MSLAQARSQVFVRDTLQETEGVPRKCAVLLPQKQWLSLFSALTYKTNGTSTGALEP